MKRGSTSSSGYWRSQDFPLRETIGTVPLSTKQIARTPSHFTSYSHPAPRGGELASVPFIGAMLSGIGARTAPLGIVRLDS